MNNLFCILRLNLYIEFLFREDLYDRSFLAESEASGLYNLNVVLEAFFFQNLFERFIDCISFRSFASRTTAN